MSIMTPAQRDFIVALSASVHGPRGAAFLDSLKQSTPQPTKAQASHWIESLKAQRDSDKPRALIVDMDGTATDVRGIRHYLDGEHRDFHRFHVASNFAPANGSVLDLVRSTREQGMKTVIVTARQSQYRSITTGWLEKHGVEYDAILMRATTDTRPDYEVKKDILARVRERFNPVWAVDDNPNVLALWAEEGIGFTRVPGFEGDAPEGPIVIDNPFAGGVSEESKGTVTKGAPTGPTPKVEDGRYAVPTEDGHLAFYRVNSPTSGQWAGRTFVNVYASDAEHPVRGKAAATVLAKIAADPQEALARFGLEMGVCGACGRSLTDEESRARGIGPTCASKRGM